MTFYRKIGLKDRSDLLKDGVLLPGSVELLTWRSETSIVLQAVCPLWMEQWIIVAITGLQDEFLVSPMKMHSMVAEQQLNPISPYWEMPNI